MTALTIGIIKEGKTPQDNRTPLTPEHCQRLMTMFPDIKIIAEPSDFRCFNDEEYQNAGVEVTNDLEKCDLLLGIKEVPTEQLISGKTYMFFSHTTKMQPYNREMLQEVINKNIQLVDYELLKNENGSRLIGFGHYAGVVGCHYALMMHGQRHGLYDVAPAHECEDYKEMLNQYKGIAFQPFKLAITGSGRVGLGAKSLLDDLGISQVGSQEFLDHDFDHPVYTILSVPDLYRFQESKEFDAQAFFDNPSQFESNFMPYTRITDILVNCIYWDPEAPRHFQYTDIKNPRFSMRTIADISCDIDGSVPLTIQYSYKNDPFYGIDRFAHEMTEPFKENSIDIMAIGNLPNELPRDSSHEFGEVLTERILPNYFDNPESSMFKRATITRKGDLTKEFQYLSGYIEDNLEKQS